MRKIIAILVLASLFLISCQKDYTIDEMKACSSDDDCIVVEGRGCCGCDTVINKNYEDYWYDRSPVSCPGRLCKVCQPIPEAGKCENNLCIPITPGFS
ncbi:hypothetical protein ACFL0W_02510 [Nanoarchaeota archaeon]